MQLVAELSKCPVLEKDQRFLPEGTFLQSSRQATKAHHILQDVSFFVVGAMAASHFSKFLELFPLVVLRLHNYPENSWMNQTSKFSQTFCAFSSSQGFQNISQR